MATTKLDSFNVIAKVNLDVALDIKAESLEDAIVRARQLKVEDWAECQGDLNDSEITVTGVFS